ncbi:MULTISPECIES: response regulator [unclassified Butyrivibrio]|uniref:response regulator n=1 Tax=unclassified Butyrivibrio TaxID=2639466 RepID=UPI0004130174|nr:MULTISPECIES: response regulator [unclassified Butyrivibrio]
MFDKKILIVDDDPTILMTLERILSNEYSVLSASSGQEGIELYERHRPDIILCDYLMPQMTGFEMMDILHERFGRAIFVIFMTGNEQDETELEVYKHGALEFMRKPIKASDLLKTISACIERVNSLKM